VNIALLIKQIEDDWRSTYKPDPNKILFQ